MNKNNPIASFSKWTKKQKIEWLICELNLDAGTEQNLVDFELDSSQFQQVISDLSENQISNYHLPFTVAPNFLINGKMKVFPLVTEESSVVAALAKASGFWSKRGGFSTQVIGKQKKGQVHFSWSGDPEKLKSFFPDISKKLLKDTESLTHNMRKRGGGVLSIDLKPLPEIMPNYYQLDVAFETGDAMGANFINSCLEQFGKSLGLYILDHDQFHGDEEELEVIMCILSNYVPDCRVKAWVSCSVADLGKNEEEASVFVDKFIRAVQIAKADVSRAVTHNKGIFNGIDALALATGNDFRAIEAGAHAYAARNGAYSSLTQAELKDDQFIFSIELPLAVGTVGGITAVHPFAKLAMQILEDPSADDLMGYLAVAGLASNWSAVNALVTTGIQRGHMKMHLSNILNVLNASDLQKEIAQNYFKERSVSFSDVETFLKNNG